MNTKLLMTVSALVMGITGIILSFLPHEVLNHFNATNYGFRYFNLANFRNTVFCFCYGELDSKGESDWWNLCAANRHWEPHSFCCRKPYFD